MNNNQQEVKHQIKLVENSKADNERGGYIWKPRCSSVSCHESCPRPVDKVGGK